MQQYQVSIPFPLGGLDESPAFDRVKSAGGREELPVTPSCQNVRGFDPRTGRARGGSRSGLAKYLDDTHVSGSVRIQCLDHVVTAQGTPSQTQVNVRAVTPFAVASGVIEKFNSSAFTSASGTYTLSSTVPAIFSTSLFQKAYLVDGTNYVEYDPSTNTASVWEATDEVNAEGDDGGTLPSNGGDTARLICTWRSRIVLSGVKSDPHNWFMSAVGYPEDWQYGPTQTCETQAVAGNNSAAGLVGDVINTMIPYTDDVLIFGCDHSIWQMRGDPMAGGRIDMVSDVTGMSWGRPWCKDPSGIIYFFGSRGGVYRMVPNSPPERISRKIEERLATVNLNTSLVRLVWNDREQGFHLFISPLTTGATTHYFYDARMNAWWPDVFANTAHNPIAVHVLDGDDPDDRVILLGGQNGRVYKLDSGTNDDDGTAINSFVKMGPIKLKGPNQAAILTDLAVELGTGSDDVTAALFKGESAQAAVAAATARESYTLSAGRNRSKTMRVDGHSLILRLSQNALDSAWSMESATVTLRETGRSFGRRF